MSTTRGPRSTPVGLVTFRGFGRIVVIFILTLAGAVTAHASDFTGDFLGGLAGSATEGMISDCYAAATVGGTYGVRTGGLIGWSSIPEPIIVHCFWDIESSLPTVSRGETGLTMAEMQARGTFTQAGWNFHTTWMICNGQDYPRLQWSGKALCAVRPARKRIGASEPGRWSR